MICANLRLVFRWTYIQKVCKDLCSDAIVNKFPTTSLLGKKKESYYKLSFNLILLSIRKLLVQEV